MIAGVFTLLLAALATADQVGQDAYLKGAAVDPGDRFGCAVAVSGDVVVVGARLEDGAGVGVAADPEDDGAPAAGAVSVFVRDGDAFVAHAYLKASDSGPADQFGAAVAIDGETLVVGAPDHEDGAGAAYVFVLESGAWVQQALLLASNGEGGEGVGDQFGSAVAVAGDTIVVGAVREDGASTGVGGDEADNGATFAGAAYVFVRDGVAWTQQAYLKASNTDASDFFGGSVAISGDTVVVGAAGEDSAATGVDGDGADDAATTSGAAYVFAREGTRWSQQAYLKASNTGPGDAFRAVSISGDTIVVGAPGESSAAAGVDGDQTDDGALGAGAAYVFVRDGASWSQQAYLKASNPGGGSFFEGPGDEFGTSVAVSGETIVVGARHEASAATGVGGDEQDDDATSSGAVYVFARDGVGWTQRAYVKASNAGAADEFGGAVALAGTTLVVGATGEASLATGVDGEQLDDAAPDAGAAYVFGLDVTTWFDEGSALAGVDGEPQLVGTGTLEPGSGNALTLLGAAPDATAALFVSVASAPISFKGGVLEAFPPALPPIVFSTSGAGTAAFEFTWPAGLPSATELHFQLAVEDAAAVQGIALSNAVKGVTP